MDSTYNYLVQNHNTNCIKFIRRLLIGLVLAGLVYVTPSFIVNHELPTTYYIWLLLIYGFQQVNENRSIISPFEYNSLLFKKLINSFAYL